MADKLKFPLVVQKGREQRVVESPADLVAAQFNGGFSPVVTADEPEPSKSNRN
jgi:hypothetical protein